MPVTLEFSGYAGLSDSEADARIRRARTTLGERLVILGHHYQRDEVFQHADFTGDSLKLSREAAASKAAYIVFCGVHFMAEVADILSRDDQTAILPDLDAGCSMADMANLESVERAWRELAALLDVENEVTPVTYINSAADLKAFCGDHGGVVCTSSNAGRILDWCYQQRSKVLFFPDQHLGRNTAYAQGMPLESMVVWDYEKPQGGLTATEIKEAKIILWKGFCSVHQMFQAEQIDNFKARYPETKVIAHPESSFAVCQKSDAVGSTEMIIKTVAASPEGTRWLVATELNLVNRLHQQFQHQNKSVHFMSPTVCLCSTMYRIDPQHLAWILENLVEGWVVNPIKVEAATASSARLALQRMLDISA
ncbi:MAG: quinolinate synthase NadA [Gammaproteobacteria bacterium]|nr:quinolinate synthase NadA [Gammaproteobacteria bacterium]